MNTLQRSAGWRIGVDVGGTFTDLALLAPDRGLVVTKVPTVTADPSEGVLDALARAAHRMGLDLAALLHGCSLFVHGSTIATNTVLEGKGARTGLLASDGFRDALEIRRGQREDPWRHRDAYPPVLVPRSLRRPVRGRLDRSGRECEGLALEDVDEALAVFERAGVDAIAVSLFNSFLTDAHELAAVERLRARFPGPISRSSAVAPIMGEFERTSTTVLDAYVAPRTLAYLRRLGARLAELGLRTPLLLIQSNGGAVSIDELGERPVTLLLSGPASGVGALDYFRQSIGSGDLVSMEIGGTSCDVILMSGGRVDFTDMLDIGGYRCVTPAVDVHTIGAGGGTIAHVDAAGLLQVGPHGAGARPGPACYGFGGSEATVTDAHVALGRLEPGPYADGAVTLDADLASAVIERTIAAPLRVSTERAAIGILELMEQKLLHAVQRVSSERGYDPRQLTLVAAGGAGPLHAAAVGRALGCPQAYVPRLSGAFCALGMLHANVRHDFLRMHLHELGNDCAAALTPAFLALEAEARAALAREGFLPDATELRRALDLRYRGQQWDITVPVDRMLDASCVRRDFDAEHQRLFGHIQPGGAIEITKVRVSAVGLIPPLPHARFPRAEAPATPHGRRRVWIDARAGWRDTPVYHGRELHAGHRLEGPAIVDEQTTTVLIGAADVLEVDATGNFRITLDR